VYRQALDRVMTELVGDEALNSIPPTPPSKAGKNLAPLNKGGWGDLSNQHQVTDQERYNLEMAFSRGLYPGWFRGINNQELVHARFGKKRGVYLGEVVRIHNDQVTVRLQAPIKPGDGLVFDSGHPEAKEEGGRVYAVEQRGQEAVLTFGRRDLNLRRVHVGDKLWKTSDPELDRQLRQSFAGENPQFQRPIQLEVQGEVGQPLIAIARDELGHVVQVESSVPLETAHTKPLTTERLQEQLGRLGNTPFCLDNLTNNLKCEAMLPVSELNHMRREIVVQLEELRCQPKRWHSIQTPPFKTYFLGQLQELPLLPPSLIVLVRNLKQLQAALQAGIETLYCEFEDPPRLPKSRAVSA
jgi:putative protease